MELTLSEGGQILEKLESSVQPMGEFDVSVGNPNKTYLDLLEKSKDHEFIFGVKGNKLMFLKGSEFLVHYGSDGAGTSVFLNTFIEVLVKTLKCNIEMFSICFRIELKEAIEKVFDRYNVEVEILDE